MIKFRAWYKKNTLPMLSVSLISFDQKFIDAYIDKEFQSETEMSFNFDEIILMQSTGLFDKNGKNVFDGDIIKIASGEIFEIKCYSGGFVYSISGNSMRQIGADTIGELETEVKEIAPHIEVIGNIHESPDLLEVTDD